MSTQKILALVLIVLGALGLAYGGFDYTQKTHKADLGPVHIVVNEEKHVSIPVWAGAGMLIVGVLLLSSGKKA